MFRPVTTKEMKEHPWVTLKITNVVTGEEEERSFSLKNFLSRYTSVAEDYMHHGKYSVIGKFYDRIIWTFQIPTAATDGVRLFFNPGFVKEVIDKSGEAAKPKVIELVKKGINWKDPDNPAKFDVRFEGSKYFLFIIMHECYHMIYRHVEQSKRKKETATGGEYIHWLANTSMDIEINRDIEKQWPEFEGATVATDGWFKPEYGNKVWTVIFDERYAAGEHPDHKEKIIPPTQEVDDDQNGGMGGMDMPEQQEEAAEDYVGGWLQAIEDYKNGLIDLDNFNPLAVDKSKFTHKVLGEMYGYDVMSGSVNEAAVAPSGVNVDEWNQGYNDCIKAILNSAKQQGAGGKGGLKITNLPQPPSLAKNNQQNQNQDSDGGSGSGGDSQQQDQNQQGQGGGSGSSGQNQQDQNGQQNQQNGQGSGSQGSQQQNGNKDQTGNGSGASPIKKSNKLGDDGDQQSGGGSGQQGNQQKSGQNSGQKQQSGAGQQNGQNQQGNGGGQSGDNQQNGQGNRQGNQQQGAGQNGQNQQNGQGQKNGQNQNGQGSGAGQQDGQKGQGEGDGEEKTPVYRVSIGMDWGAGDLITVEQGLKILEQEGEMTDADANTTPEEHAKKIIKQVRDKLREVGRNAGKGMSMEDRMLQIEEALKPPQIKWKALLLRHFKELGVKPDIDSKMKRARFGIDRADRFEKIEDFKVEEQRRKSADIFYLVDNSGSISDEDLQIVFRELIGLETRTGLDIRKAAMTYFSDDFLEDRIRLWYKDTTAKEKMRLVKRVAGKDPSGGTNIGKSVVHVTELKKSKNRHMRELFSTSNPRTLIIVFTDGIDDTYGMIGKLPKKIREKILFVIMNQESDSWGFKAIIPKIIQNGVPAKNIVCIDTSKDLGK